MKVNMSEKLNKINSFIDNPNAKETRWFYYILLGFFVFGFIFFLTSNLWMTEDKAMSTNLGTTMNLTNYTSFTLKKWDYDTQNKVMEIELKKTSDYINTDYSYSVTANTIKGKAIQVNVQYDSNDFIVLQLVNVPKSNQINLNLGVKIIDNEKVSTYSESFYCDTNTVNKTTLDTQIKSDVEYKIDSLNSDIILTQIKIDTAKQEQSLLYEQISAYNERIKSIEDNKEFQTQTELEFSNDKIDSLQKNIVATTSQIDMLNKNISTHEDEIKMIRTRIADLSKN